MKDTEYTEEEKEIFKDALENFQEYNGSDFFWNKLGEKLDDKQDDITDEVLEEDNVSKAVRKNFFKILEENKEFFSNPENTLYLKVLGLLASDEDDIVEDLYYVTDKLEPDNFKLMDLIMSTANIIKSDLNYQILTQVEDYSNKEFQKYYKALDYAIECKKRLEKDGVISYEEEDSNLDDVIDDLSEFIYTFDKDSILSFAVYHDRFDDINEVGKAVSLEMIADALVLKENKLTKGEEKILKDRLDDIELSTVKDYKLIK